jgi:hypothetical protein
MILEGQGRLVRAYPPLSGIDFAGTVRRSDSPEFWSGDPVVLTGWRVGEVQWGVISGDHGIIAAHAEPDKPSCDVRPRLVSASSSVPEYQYQNNDRYRNAEKPKKNTFTHGLPPTSWASTRGQGLTFPVGTASSNDVFPRQRFTNPRGGLPLSCQRRPVNGKPASARMAGSRLAP